MYVLAKYDKIFVCFQITIILDLFTNKTHDFKIFNTFFNICKKEKTIIIFNIYISYLLLINFSMMEKFLLLFKNSYLCYSFHISIIIFILLMIVKIYTFILICYCLKNKKCLKIFLWIHLVVLIFSEASKYHPKNIAWQIDKLFCN